MVHSVERILLSLTALLVASAIVSASALAAVEAPYWRVSGVRLGAGKSKEITVTNVAGKETVIHGEIKGKKVEIRCKALNSKAGTIIGSNPKEDGKAEIRFNPRECRLFVNFGEGFTEQKGCKVADIESTELVGRLWYEGEKEEAGQKIAIVFEPKEAKSSLLATITITENKESKEPCEFANKYSLEGKVAALVSPENSEATKGKIIFPSPSIVHVWQPQTTETLTLSLKFGGSPATMQGEAETALVSKEEFGAFSK
jgi:hypothetical protein